MGRAGLGWTMEQRALGVRGPYRNMARGMSGYAECEPDYYSK